MVVLLPFPLERVRIAPLAATAVGEGSAAIYSIQRYLETV